MMESAIASEVQDILLCGLSVLCGLLSALCVVVLIDSRTGGNCKLPCTFLHMVQVFA